MTTDRNTPGLGLLGVLEDGLGLADDRVGEADDDREGDAAAFLRIGRRRGRDAVAAVVTERVVLLPAIHFGGEEGGVIAHFALMLVIFASASVASTRVVTPSAQVDQGRHAQAEIHSFAFADSCLIASLVDLVEPFGAVELVLLQPFAWGLHEQY